MGSQVMTWLEKLALERYVNRSNVFLIISEDPKRLRQFLQQRPDRSLPVIDNIFSNEERKPRSVYSISLQAPIYVALRGDPVPDSAKANILSWLWQRLISEPTVAVLYWVVTKEHVRRVLDFLLLVAQHPEVYQPRSERLERVPQPLPSSVVVFTFSEALWPSEALRFFSVIEVEPSTSVERRELINYWLQAARRRGYRVEANLDEAVNASAGLTLHDVETAVLEAVKLRKPINAATFSKYKQELLRRYGLEYVEPKRGFESVGGYDYLKEFLLYHVVLFYREPALAETYGITPPRGLLLFGPPGTGKTWLTKALAREMGLPMVKLSAADILRGIVGESEQRAKKIARIIESMAPIVVFIDEADQLFRSRDTTLATDSGVSQRVQNILLDWLGDEDRRSFIVMATNYLAQFDFASVRAGRIDYAVPVMLPDRKAREQILRLHMEVLARPKIPVEVDYEAVAAMTPGYTAAELAEVAKRAKLTAALQKAQTITTEHVVEAVKSLRIDVEARKKLVIEMLEQARKVTTVVIPSDLLEKARAVLSELENSQEQPQPQEEWRW